MIYTGYDLPLSLHTCDKLGRGRTQLHGRCVHGELPVVIRRPIALARSKDLLYPCNAVAEKYKFYCYDLVTARILPKVSYNWKKAAAWCRRSEPKWVPVCFQSMGRDASGFTRLDPRRIVRICRVAGNMARECIFAASEDMTYTDVNANRAKNLCKIAPAGTRGSCWIAIGEILGQLTRDARKLKQQCDQAAQLEADRRSCYQGAAI
jgi:hypothetical protein